MKTTYIKKDSMETIKKAFEKRFPKRHTKTYYGWIFDPDPDPNDVWSFIEQALSSQEKRLTKEMREKIEEGLYDWYAKRQIEYGRSAWTDDYFSQGDTLSGTIIPIIRKSLLDSSKKC
jgi:hypothetical protein